MNTGMMWLDNSKSTLSEKILKAAQYYRIKYGRVPDTCVVHPSMLVGQEFDPAHVKSARYILPGNLWIGVQEVA